MLLSTIFEALTYGELKQLALGGAEDSAGIHPTYSGEVLAHLNLGLLNLYEKFPLQEKQLTIRTQDGIHKYLLTAVNALSQNVNGYIQDSVEDPFLEDILRINAAYDSNGSSLNINDESTYYSVYLPDYNTIQIPYANPDEDYSFSYRVKPPTIVIPGGSTPSTVEVPLPSVLLEPLLTYISARAHNAKAGEKGKQEGAYNMQQYEKMCLDVETKNIFNSSLTNGNRKKEINGWP